MHGPRSSAGHDLVWSRGNSGKKVRKTGESIPVVLVEGNAQATLQLAAFAEDARMNSTLSLSVAHREASALEIA